MTPRLKALRQLLRNASPEQHQTYLEGLSLKDRRRLLKLWEIWARDEQLPPEGDWDTWLLNCGRGFGKTKALAEWVRSLVLSQKPGERLRIAMVGRTHNDILNTFIKGESGLLACWDQDNDGPLDSGNVILNQYEVRFPNGALGFWYTADEPDKLRGPQHHYAVCDELAAWPNIRETWANLKAGLRLGKHPQIAIATTPRPLPFLRKLMAEPGTISLTRSSYDNRANLPDQTIKYFDSLRGSRLWRQEVDAEILDEVGLLFKTSWIGRIAAPADLKTLTRIVVAVDPATTTNKDSDETGIIIAGIDSKGIGYVLEDLSGKHSPDAWAKIVIDAYRFYKASHIVIETNQGGEAWETIIKSKDPGVKICNVQARVGKSLRAEPVAALYERGAVNHPTSVNLEELEKQLEGFPLDKKSPDRVDALVYALSALFYNLIPQPRGMLQTRLAF